MEDTKPPVHANERPVTSFTLMPDHFTAYGWENDDGSHRLGGCIADSGEPGGWGGTLKISKALSRRFDQWQPKFRVCAEMGTDGLYVEKWTAFHREGMALARALKREIGSRARVFYEKPSEDPDCRVNERCEIQEDESVLVFRRVGNVGRDFVAVPKSDSAPRGGRTLPLDR